MSRTRRGIRWLVFVAVLAASVAVGLLAAQDALLKTDRLQRLVSSDPERTLLNYSGARSRWPGRVELDSLTLRIRDDRIELLARLEGVSLRVALPDLVRKRFHATSVEARRLSFRLRERLTPGELRTAPARLYPPIEGFPDPPTRPEDEPRRHSEGKWRVVVDDLRVADVREIWVDAWRWTGKGQVRGGFELLPGREAVVGPARLSVEGGELRRGESLAEGTRGEVWAELPRFSPREYPGNDVWKIMNGGAKLRAALARFTLGKLSGAGGTLAAEVNVRKGAGTVDFDADVRRAALQTSTRSIHGAARLDLRAPRVDFARWQASLSGSRLALSDVSVDGSQESAPWSTTLRASDARLSLSSGVLAARIDGSVRDARPLVALVPSGLGRMGAELLHLDGLRVSGNLRVAGNALDIRSARGEAGNVTIDADYRRRGRSERGAILVRKGALKVAVELEDGKAHIKPGLKEPPAITNFFRKVKEFFTD